MTTFFPSSRLSRRRFLKNSALSAGALAGAGALLDACDTSTAGPSSSGTTTLTIMGSAAEILPEYDKEFEKSNPGVKINLLNFDQTRLNAMFAAGSPPDIIRGYGFDSAYNAARGLALNLSPYMAKSSVLKESDLLPIQNVWRWDGKQVGKGPIYGLTKDWSPDGMYWCNAEVFKKKGLEVPSPTTPTSYDEVLTLAKQLVVKQGSKIQTYGIDPQWPNSNWGAGNIYQMVAQQGGQIFSSDLTKADFTTPQAIKALQWYVDFGQAHIGISPFDPDPSWSGALYLSNRVGMMMWGYWYGGSVLIGAPEDLKNNSSLIPAPLMGPKRISSCYSATGHWISAQSKVKDLAWKWMEYFMTGKPASDRAKNGWGVPTIASFVTQLPQSIPWQKRIYDALQNELQYFEVLPTSPYTTNVSIGTVMDPYLQKAVKGQISVSDASQQITTAVNLLLQQGQQTAG